MTLLFRTTLKFGQEVREKVMEGVDTVYQAVSTTLGPRGRNIIIVKPFPNGDIRAHESTHDGVSVASSIELKDEYANTGAQVIIESAKKTVDEVGDGTTLTIVLARSILKECMQIIATGVNPMKLRKGLEQHRNRIVSEIDRYSSPIKSLTEAQYIATVSAEDHDLGKLVGEVMYKIGVDGVVTIEESRSRETTVEYQDGLQIDQGYMNEQFVTNVEEMAAVYDNPYFLVTDREINQLTGMQALLEELSKRARPLVIITPGCSMEVVGMLALNKLKGVLQVLPIKAPAFGEVQKAMLWDIAIATGATFISEDTGYRLEDVTIDHLGRAAAVNTTAKETLIIEGKGKKADIKARVTALKKQLAQEDDDFKQIKLKERIGKLSNGIAVIYVGGYTETEMKERKDRVDDAVHATRAALQHGIIPGGETIFLRILPILGDSVEEQILANAITEPFKKLVTNAGLDAGEYMVKLQQQWQTTKNQNIGFDVTDMQFKDFMQAGLVDPTLVPQKALANAVSVAVQLMITEGIIAPIWRDRKQQP